MAEIATVAVDKPVQEAARKSVDEKKSEGYGSTRTTAPSNRGRYDEIAMTGALGELLFVKWVRQNYPEKTVEMKPLGHDYDIEIDGLKIDVKASAKKPRGRIKVQNAKIDSKDVQPDLWVKIDGVKTGTARIRGFAYHAGLTDHKNRKENVYGNGRRGYVVGPDSLQFLEDISLLRSEIESADADV